MKDSGRGLLDGSWLSRWNMFVRVDGIAVQDFFRSLHWHCWHAWNLLGWPRALRLGHYIIVIWRDGFDSAAAGSEEEDPLQPLLLKVATAFKCVVCFASPVTDLLIACLIDWLVGWLVADRLTEKVNYSYSGIMIAQFKISAQIDYHARAHTHTHTNQLARDFSSSDDLTRRLRKLFKASLSLCQADITSRDYYVDSSMSVLFYISTVLELYKYWSNSEFELQM